MVVDYLPAANTWYLSALEVGRSRLPGRQATAMHVGYDHNYITYIIDFPNSVLNICHSSLEIIDSSLEIN